MSSFGFVDPVGPFEGLAVLQRRAMAFFRLFLQPSISSADFFSLFASAISPATVTGFHCTSQYSGLADDDVLVAVVPADVP
jgi:hypothetical protein